MRDKGLCHKVGLGLGPLGPWSEGSLSDLLKERGLFPADFPPVPQGRGSLTVFRVSPLYLWETLSARCSTGQVSLGLVRTTPAIDKSSSVSRTSPGKCIRSEGLVVSLRESAGAPWAVTPRWSPWLALGPGPRKSLEIDRGLENLWRVLVVCMGTCAGGRGMFGALLLQLGCHLPFCPGAQVWRGRERYLSLAGLGGGQQGRSIQGLQQAALWQGGECALLAVVNLGPVPPVRG